MRAAIAFGSKPMRVATSTNDVFMAHFAGGAGDWEEDARQPRAILAVPGTVTRRSGKAFGSVGIVSGDDRKPWLRR